MPVETDNSGIADLILQLHGMMCETLVTCGATFSVESGAFTVATRVSHNIFFIASRRTPGNLTCRTTASYVPIK